MMARHTHIVSLGLFHNTFHSSLLQETFCFLMYDVLLSIYKINLIKKINQCVHEYFYLVKKKYIKILNPSIYTIYACMYIHYNFPLIVHPTNGMLNHSTVTKNPSSLTWHTSYYPLSSRKITPKPTHEWLYHKPMYESLVIVTDKTPLAPSFETSCVCSYTAFKGFISLNASSGQ